MTFQSCRLAGGKGWLTIFGEPETARSVPKDLPTIFRGGDARCRVSSFALAGYLDEVQEFAPLPLVHRSSRECVRAPLGCGLSLPLQEDAEALGWPVA